MTTNKRISAALSLAPLSLLFCILVLASCSTSQPSTEMLGQSVPYVRFQSLDGEWHILDEYKGKTVVLVFWASWCSKSRATMQSLNSFAKRSGHPDRVFVAVNLDKIDDEKKFRDFIKNVPIDSFMHSYSGNDAYDEAFVRMNGSELPHIFIIDPTGTVKAVGHSDSVVFDYFGEIRD